MRYIHAENVQKLFKRSFFRCAICGMEFYDKCPLEMAHICSSKPNGPRYAYLDDECSAYRIIPDLNHYNNLILLCANDHTQVDNNVCVRFWTPERLTLIKKFHEKYCEFLIKRKKPALTTTQWTCQSEELKTATDAATLGNSELAITCYLKAMVEGIKKNQIDVVIVAAVSIAPLLNLKAMKTGTNLGRTCCNRALELLKKLDLGHTGKLYKIAAVWNLAYLDFHAQSPIDQVIPDTKDIISRLREAGAFGLLGKQPPLLPYPTIFAGETSRRFFHSAEFHRDAPINHLYLSPDYLSLYLTFDGNGKKGANLYLHSASEVEQNYDGLPQLAHASVVDGNYNDAIRRLRMYEDHEIPSASRLDLEIRHSNIQAVRAMIGNSQAPSRCKRSDHRRVIAAASGRNVEGDKDAGFENVAWRKIRSTPCYYPFVREYPHIEPFLHDLKGI